MPICNCCQGTHFEVNPFDEALCCTQCGTVAEGAQLRTDEGGHFAPINMLPLPESQCIKVWLERFAFYFDGSDEMYHEALNWYRTNIHLCPRKHTKELALYIIYIVKRPLCAGLTLTSIIERCPVVIDEVKMKGIRSRLAHLSPHIHEDWNIIINLNFSNLFAFISQNMIKQHKIANKKLKTKRAVPESLPDKYKVRTMTAKLLSIFNDCANSAGKQQRVLIAAAIAVSYLFYYQKNVKTKVFNSPLLTIHKMLDYKKLADSLCCGYRTILNYLNEIQNFILVCTREIPWIVENHKNVKISNAYTFLDQVVAYIKPKDSKKIGFPLQQETVSAFLKAQEKARHLEMSFERAKQGTINDFDPNTTEWNIRTLLDNGVEEGELKMKSDDDIRQMCDVYYYRSLLNSTTHTSIPDLNQPEVTQHDMSDSEVNVYLAC